MSNGGNRRPPGGSGRELVDALRDLTKSLFEPPPEGDGGRRAGRPSRGQASREDSEAASSRSDEKPRSKSSEPAEQKTESSDKKSTGERQERTGRKRGSRSSERGDNPSAGDIPRALRNFFQMFDEGTTTSRPRDVEEPVRTLDDVIVSERVRRQILRAITGVKQHDLIYNQWGIKGIDPHGGCVAVNMFGPPGTGKSMCAEAIAHELGKPLMRVNYAQLESKFVGDTPKNIQNVFRQAYQNDAVLFFDEADSILGARLTKVDHGVDQEFNVSRSVMLQELEHFDGVVLFATNLASQYDAAFRRRMEHIEFCLPGHRSRLKLWKHMLVDKVDGKLPLDAVIDFDALAEHSKGLSGGDIQQVVLRAARTAATRTKEKQIISTDDLLQEVVHAFAIKEKVGQST